MRTSRFKQRGYWQYIIPAAAAIGSALISKNSQEDTNQDNLQIAREQMGFQERMSGTSYQRAVKDMQAAGLNPMLAAQQGGATTPTGASAVMQNPMAAGMSSALQTMQSISAVQQMAQTRAQTEQINAQTRKIDSETMEKTLNTAVMQAELRKRKAEGLDVEERIPGTRGSSALTLARLHAEREGGKATDAPGFAADVERRKAEAKRTQFDLDRAKTESDFYRSDLGIDSPYIKTIIQIIKGLASARDIRR